MKAARFFLLFIAFIASAYFVVFRGLSSSRAQSQASGTGSSCCGAEAPREVDFPYYNLSNGWQSTLLLVSDSPKPTDFTLAVKSRQGQVLTTAKTIQPQQKLSIDLAALIGQLGGDPAGGFAEGSVAVYFVGTIMPIAGQITAWNPQLSLVHETMMVEHDPGRSDIPAVLNGLWWGLGGGRAASVMVSNTSASSQSAQVYLEFQGKQHPLKAPLTFVPYETKVLDITELLTSLGVDPAQAPEGGITIIQTGGNPALIANGRITDPSSGFSSTIDFPSPDLERSSALHATGVPIGTPSNDSPFAGAGTFVPHVVVRNLLASPQTVTISLEYPQVATGNGSTPAPPAALDPVAAQDGKHSPATAQAPLAPLTLPAYSTQDISLAALINQFPAALLFCSVRIQHSGPPGSVQAEVSSIESRGNLVVDSRVQNEGNGWAGSGAHPWHLDEDTESILFLTNESDQPARVGFKVSANDVTYYMTSLQLNPHETRAIDLRKLRDAQQPDFKGNKVPAAATDGSVIWLRIDNLPVIGRLMVIHRHEGMASNYDCNNCICPASYVPWLNYMNPASASLLVQGTANLTFYAAFEGCNGSPYYYNETGSASWSSQPPGIVSVNSGTVTGQSGGTTAVTAQFSSTTYTFDPIMFCCRAYLLLGGGSSTVNVGDRTPVVSSVSPSPWISGHTYPSGTISGQYFGTNPSVSLSDPTITFSYTPVSDGQINFSATIPATTASEAVTITVTSNGYNGNGWIPPANNPGESRTGQKTVNNTAPEPTNFTQAGSQSLSGGQLYFLYQWQSNTGNPSDLQNCTVGEVVTYPGYVAGQQGVYLWPNPPWPSSSSPNPTTANVTGNNSYCPWGSSNGTAPCVVDTQNHGAFGGTYGDAAFNANQTWEYTCPGVNSGNAVTLIGPLTIQRSVTHSGSTYTYGVTKSGAAASCILGQTCTGN